MLQRMTINDLCYVVSLERSFVYYYTYSHSNYISNENEEKNKEHKNRYIRSKWKQMPG